MAGLGSCCFDREMRPALPQSDICAVFGYCATQILPQTLSRRLGRTAVIGLLLAWVDDSEDHCCWTASRAQTAVSKLRSEEPSRHGDISSRPPPAGHASVQPRVHNTVTFRRSSAIVTRGDHPLQRVVVGPLLNQETNRSVDIGPEQKLRFKRAGVRPTQVSADALRGRLQARSEAADR